MLTIDTLKDAYAKFQQTGYTQAQLSYDQNTNISLGKFRDAMLMKEPNYFMLGSVDVNGINKFIKKAQKDYYKFAVAFANRYENNQEEIETWFRGIIGEIFIVRLLLPNFSIVNEKDGKSILNKFLYPVPATNLGAVVSNYEFGTDCVALAPNGKICAIQIKFWDLFTNQKITYGDVVSHLYTDAVCNEYIGHNDQSSMWIFWTGTKKTDVSLWLKKSPCGQKKMVEYVDRLDIDLVLKGNQNFLVLWLTEIASWK